MSNLHDIDSLERIAQELTSRDNFVICGHVSPDGDCLGSQLALLYALKALGKQVVGVLAKDEPIPHNLKFLPGVSDMLPVGQFNKELFTFVAVDVPTKKRMGEEASALAARADFSIKIDHHATPENEFDVAYVDPSAAATCILIWDLIKLLDVTYSQSMATCAYTGLMTDTGRFQFQNTDARVFEAAESMVGAGADPAELATEVYQNRTFPSLYLEMTALQRMVISEDKTFAATCLTSDDFVRFGAVKADAEPIIDSLRSLTGIRVACVLREQDGKVRGSLRAKDSTDVAAIARAFDGGGHKAAAGFTSEMGLRETLAKVSQLLGVSLPDSCEV